MGASLFRFVRWLAGVQKAYAISPSIVPDPARHHGPAIQLGSEPVPSDFAAASMVRIEVQRHRQLVIDEVAEGVMEIDTYQLRSNCHAGTAVQVANA